MLNFFYYPLEIFGAIGFFNYAGIQKESNKIHMNGLTADSSNIDLVKNHRVEESGSPANEFFQIWDGPIFKRLIPQDYVLCFYKMAYKSYFLFTFRFLVFKNCNLTIIRDSVCVATYQITQQTTGISFSDNF